MIVSNIETYQKNGEDRFKVSFEEEPDAPLIMFKQPTFEVGTEISSDKLDLKQSGNNFYYVWKQHRPREERPSDKDTSIRAQVAMKAVVDLTVAGKLEEILNAQNYLTKGVHDWIVAALIHDNVLTADALKPKAKGKAKGKKQ